MAVRQPTLTAALALWFERSLDDLPVDLRGRVEEFFVLVPWDELSVDQRRGHAANVDALNPRNKVDKDIADQAFRSGFKAVAVPRRNRRNAQKPRPSRQKVSDEAILAMKAMLDAERVPSHRQVRVALTRLGVPISVRSLRERWGRLAPKKKGG